MRGQTIQMVNRLHGKHIFIVEDHVGNRSIMEFLLEREGAKTAFDRWGEEAMIRLELFQPVDLILLDINFPGELTGYDVFQEIRTYPDFDRVPIIAVSATDAEVAIPKTQELGFNGFISKPIRSGLFIKQIIQVLNGDKIWFRG